MTHSVQIVLTDGATPIRSTFSDDSYSSAHEVYAPVVVARLPSGLDLRWHADVVATLARRSGELKAARLLNNWSELSRDLRTAILRTIREACISILDPRAYSFEFERLILRLSVGGGEAIRSRLREQFLGSYVRDRVLWSSPAWRIKRMLYPEDPFGLAEVYGVAKVTDDDDSLFEALRSKLQKPHNTRLFGARSAATFAELLDPDERSRAVDDLWDRRYFGRWDVDASILARHRSTAHIFDEGNRVSVDAIGVLRDAADRALVRRERWPIVLTPLGGLSEESSRTRRELQAADIAAGYARRLYEATDGLKKVCLEFRQVLLNGRLVRDWRQGVFTLL